MTTKRPSLPDIAAHPHDGIVKYAFSKRAHAKGLLKAVLPRRLTRAIAWNTLKLDKDTFIQPNLRKHYADLLFTVRIRGVEVRIYLLIEHQRTVDKLMMLRLLTYMTRIWERIARDDPNRATIPPIYPILIHNGDTAWTAATSFDQIVDLPDSIRADLLPRTPCFSADLVDLTPAHATIIADQWLTAFGKLVLWALSVAGDDARFLAEIGRMKDAIRESLAAADGYEALGALLRYISATHERIETQQFHEALTAAAGKSEEKTIMTLLEKFWQEGRVEGRVEGQAKTLLAQLTARFGPVPDETKARVMEADEATLARWSIRVLTEPTLAAVLDGSKPKRAKKPATGGKQARASRV